MLPESVYLHSKKGYMVEHKCERCGHVSVNKLALDDPLQPDERAVVFQLMRTQAYRTK